MMDSEELACVSGKSFQKLIKSSDLSERTGHGRGKKGKNGFETGAERERERETWAGRSRFGWDGPGCSALRCNCTGAAPGPNPFQPLTTGRGRSPLHWYCPEMPFFAAAPEWFRPQNFTFPTSSPRFFSFFASLVLCQFFTDASSVRIARTRNQVQFLKNPGILQTNYGQQGKV